MPETLLTNRTLRMIETTRFVKVIRCGDCGRELNRTVEMTGVELWDRWTQLAMGAAFASGKCSEQCRSTFRDLNLNFSSDILDAETGKAVSYEVLKWLRGHFYSDDESQRCACRNVEPDEYYRSERYGAMHRCGKWIGSGPQRYEANAASPSPGSET